MTACSVYWIHHPDHSDMLTQGYIGVSTNIRTRWNRHKREAQNPHLNNAIKKYGWDALVKKVILIADEDYCLMIEAKLRAENEIGWNIVKGGGKPPAAVNSGSFSKGSKPWNAGTKGIMGLAWNNGIPMSEDIKKKISKSKLGSVSWNKDKKGVMPPAWNKGLSTPEDVRKKQSLAKLGKPSPRKGTKHSKESIEKMRLAKLGKKHSAEAIEKGRLKRLGREQPLCTCPHCGKIGGAFTMPRWHFEKCKEKK